MRAATVLGSYMVPTAAAHKGCWLEKGLGEVYDQGAKEFNSKESQRSV